MHLGKKARLSNKGSLEAGQRIRAGPQPRSTRSGPSAPPPPRPLPPGTHDLRHDEEPGHGAEELAVVGEAAAGGGEVLGEGAGGGGDRMRARALRLLHGRAWPGLAPPRGPPARPGADKRP